MSTRRFVWFALVSMLLFGLPALGADAPAPPAGTPAAPTEPAALSAVDAKQNADIRKLREDLNRLATLAEQQGQQVTSMVSTLAEQNAELRKLRADFDRITDTLDRQLAEQRSRLEQVSERDNQGNYVPSVRGSMAKSPEFREAMVNVVHDSLRKQGTLRIQNQMGVGVQLRVNNEQTYYIAPYSTHADITVPVGTLTTELVGYESPKNWTIGAPNYFQQINVTPSASRVLVAPAPVVLPSAVMMPWWY